MWDRRYVSDTCDNQACALQRPYSSLTARSRSPDQHVYLSQSLVHPSASGLLRSALSGKAVPLREPLKPTVPPLADEITPPCGSVILTSVLLKVE